MGITMNNRIPQIDKDLEDKKCFGALRELPLDNCYYSVSEYMFP